MHQLTFVARDALVQRKLRINASGKDCISSWRCSHGQNVCRMHLRIRQHISIQLDCISMPAIEQRISSNAAATAY